MYGHLATIAGSTALDAALQRETMRKKPFEQSLGGGPDAPSADAIALMEQLDKRAVASGSQEPSVDVRYTDPSVDKRSRMAANTKLGHPETGEVFDNQYRVYINPNTDKSFFAHELGHIASDRTKVGNMVRTLRDNPYLKNALITAGALGGGAVAFTQEGTDDVDEAIALSLLAATPTLADEAFATQQGLGMLKSAGMQATPGQKLRLAGGYLSYVASPVIAALGSNFAGNLIGQDYQGM